MQRKNNKGFTLIELSIVIVIIGLIVAGIIGGKNLIKQAQLRSVISDIEKYKTLYNTFELKFNGLPGDFDRAIDYFGGTTTDGNGNGKVESGAEEEHYLAWQHLSLSGLFEGDFDGNNGSVLGVDLPNSPFSAVGYLISSYSAVADDYLYDAGSSLIADMGTLVLDGSIFEARGSYLSPSDAASLDIKSDDGEIDSGQVLGFTGQDVTASLTTAETDGECGTGTSPNRVYNLTDTSINCRLIFLMQKQ